MIIWVTAPFVVAITRHSAWFWRPRYYSSFVAWAGVLLVALGFAATRVCWKRMGSAWRMGIDPREQTEIIATGPFAYVRHPIYALSQLMMLATIAAVPSPLMIAVGALHLVLLQWESRREEAHLLRVHPEQYARYSQQVGRFLPKRIGPYSGS